MTAGNSVLDAVGGTALVSLSRMFDRRRLRVHAKLEMLNPAGSMKDRSALNMLQHALASGRIRVGSVIVESSSGNMGIGLGQACAVLGLRLICVVDTKVAKQNLAIMRAYGAEIEIVSSPPPGMSLLEARIQRVQDLLQAHPGSYWPNQYANLHNPGAHHRTMMEIHEQVGSVDYIFGAVSTCGTLRGVTEYSRDAGLQTMSVAVDSAGSTIFDDSRSATRRFPGHGAARRPELFYDGVADRVCYISDLECVVGCRRLVREEGIFAGASSGGVISAALRMLGSVPVGASCVLILADRGDRYLDTIYDDAWVHDQFGEVTDLWHAPRAAAATEPEGVQHAP
ncbi:MAG TPA: 2,3-diaminopropionate biosynthesis protein SbnA [Polyangiaceae bacterium]|nr:2,3-diaminopropionate biosynthesis protein SbnA [Polyangiaceae bacterium]